MRKAFYFCIFLLSFCLSAKADHITGGEIYYTYTVGANGNYNYSVTFKLFMRCYSNRQFNNPTIVSIFDRGTNQRIQNMEVPLASSEQISLDNPDPCISNPPTVCYVVGYYNFNVSLPATPNGYILSSQVNFRIAGINNLQTGYNNVGALYTAEIPGIGQVNSGPKNNSAKFVGNDLVVVCANNRFAYSFAAQDDDGDQLRYSFCDAYNSTGGGGGGNMAIPPSAPPYQPVPYGNGYGGSGPLGGNVQINPSTGLITGIAPESGIYVVTVCVEEVRNGMVIATQRKDLQINIAPCNVAAAMLEPEYMLCKDTKTISLVNMSSSPLVRTYYWEISNRSGTTLNVSSNPVLTYTFADTGTYNIKLVINRGDNCSDSTTSIARVYPGFVPGFNFTGICFTKPTFFTDATTTSYGKVNGWYWNFGTSDTSRAQNPVYTYTTLGTWNTQLIVTNSVGCRDTIVKPVNIVTAPPINLAFKDTLICLGDPVTLIASGSGIFSWTPNINMLNSGSPNPTVTPSVTTAYVANLNDNGCLNKDTVLVRVTDRVSLQVMNDTTICAGDTIRLHLQSDAFKYSWTPAIQLINPNVANPFAVTKNTTTYQVTANIGSCSATNRIVVTTVPYPFVNAGNDTIICFNTAVQLRGVSDGSVFRWAPAQSLNSAVILNPVATPVETTDYILSAFDTRGCPKRSTDTILVTVLPDIAPFAGNDTSIIVEQPLQLNATGGTTYLWTPSTGLSSPTIPNPVALYSEPYDAIRYKVLVSNEAGCIDSAFVTVKIFSTGPTVFVPSAFTPNADGKNDVLRPIAVGMKQIDFFSVYNRWGQRVFTTQVNGKGWDGTVNGVQQPTGVFVWMVKAVDYNGKQYLKKGTVTLIK